MFLSFQDMLPFDFENIKDALNKEQINLEAAGFDDEPTLLFCNIMFGSK